MIITKKTTQMLTFTVPLSTVAHSIARESIDGIINKEKSKKVYLNTLAVFAVDFYLNCMGFATSWSSCNSRDRLLVKLMDVADLEIKDLGLIECRYVLPNQNFCQIPPEVWSDRLGYVIVEFNESLTEAIIRGFVTSSRARVYLENLQSLENLIEYLSCLKPVQTKIKTVRLGQWLHGFFESGWQDLKEVLDRDRLGFVFREEINIAKAKKIDLGLDVAETSFALVVKISSNSDCDEINIVLQLHPCDRTYLPSEIQLIVCDNQEEIPVIEAKAREKDNFIQLEFSATANEKFKAIIIFGNTRLEQEFTA